MRLKALSLWGRYAMISLRAQMQYRASFWALLIASVVLHSAEFFGIWALFDRFGQIRGWSLAEIGVCYGLCGIAFALAEGLGRGFDAFANMTRYGHFDRLLLRPLSTEFQVAAQEVQLMRVGRLVQASVVLLVSLSWLNVDWSPSIVLLLIGCLVGGFCAFYGLLIVQAAICFWTIESLEAMNAITYGGVETAQFPLTIYRDGFRRFFTFVVPVAGMNYLPVTYLVGKGGGWEIWCAPLLGAAFLIVALRFWRFGASKYTSTGS